MNILFRNLSRFVLLALCLASLPAQAALEAGGYQRFDALAPKGFQSARNFGFAIAVEGDLAVIGAPSEAVDGKLLHGVAYVFTQSDGRWRQRERLALADGNASMRFGNAVAISGGQILVGAPGASGGGQVYVFDGSGSTWSESQRFRPSGTGGFGYAMAVDGDRLLVGAPEESGGGRAYVYTRSGGTWAYGDQLEASDRSSGDKFGRAVALDADHAVVGAPFQGSLSKGSAYPFEFDGLDWNAGTPLNNIDTPSAYQGWALTMAGDHLLVGAPGEDGQGENSVGTVLHYQFGCGRWQLQERVEGPAEANAAFGTSLAFDGSVLFVGAPGVARAWGRRGQLFESALQPSGFASPLALPDPDMAEGMGRSLALFSGGLLTGDPFSDVGGVSSDGRVTVLRNNGDWHVDGVLDTPVIDATQRFGSVVSVFGNRAAVGVPWADVGANSQQGAVQIFEFDGQRWQWSATVTDPFGNASDRFGSSLRLDGDRLIVGAPNRENSGSSAGGSAVLFEFDGNVWNDVYRYDNSFAAGDRMGTAVTIDGDRAAIGAPRYEAGVLNDSGLVVVLERVSGAWSIAGYLAGAAADERLGGALAFAGGTLAAAATNADAGAGRVRIYRKLLGSWSQLTSIAAPAGASGFGKALDFRNGLLAIGAPDGDGGAGRVAVYSEGVTSFSVQTLPAIPVASLDSVGSAVSVDGDRLVAGGLDNGADAAALFVFDRDAGGNWRYTGRIGSPDGSGLFPDGFGTALSLRRPHLLAGAEWRALDEGRVFAYIEGRDNSVAIDSLSPTQPVTGQPIAIQASVSNVDGPADGRVRWWREDQAACTAVLAAGSGSCSLPGADVGVQTFVGEFLPDQLPDLPRRTAAAGYQVVAADTRTSLSAMPASVHPGGDIQLMASVSVQAPGSGVPLGSLSFHAGDPDSTPALCTLPVGSGGCTVSAGSVGTMNFQVRYSGNASFIGSDSTLQSVEVTPWPTMVSVANVSPLPARVGQVLGAMVTVSADIAAGVPTGRVRLVLDGQPGNWKALDGSGQATPNIVPTSKGTQVLMAEFDGQDGSFSDAGSNGQPYTVVGLSSTVDLMASPGSAVQVGDSVTLQATVSLEDESGATGTMSIHPDSADNPALCSFPAPAGSCQFTPTTVGNHDLVAVYAGDDRSVSAIAATSVSAQLADTATQITTISAVRRVDQPYSVSVLVTSDYGTISGTVTIGDGESSCVATLTGATGSCELTPSYLGMRSISAHFAADDGIHADSDAADSSIEVEGIPVSLTLGLPGGPYQVGDTIELVPGISASDDSEPDDGILTLRLDDASGSIVCSENPPLASCPLTLPQAGQQGFYLSYAGSLRYATTTSSGYSIIVEPIPTVLSVAGTVPATVVTNTAFDLIVEASSARGPPPGTLDVSDDDGAVCTGLLPDPGDGRYYCAMTAPPNAGMYPLSLTFTSSNVNYTDASVSHAVSVSSAIRQIALGLDDGVTSVEAGDALLYQLDVRNLASSGTVNGVVIDLSLIEGIGGLQWRCVDALGGAVCPQSGPVAGLLHTQVDLPPASLIVFTISAVVDTPAPPTIAAGVEATLPAGEINDDPGALFGVDVDIRADGLLFDNGFE